MGIFWCISITNNVKSYKKFDGKAQTAKFTVFAREISSTALKTWKTRKTKTWITQNFQILYHIQGTTMWTSTSSAFRKCGTFGVYDFLKGSYWLSKFSHFSIFFYVQKKCQKKRHGHNFDFLGLKRIAKVTHMVDQTCYSFQTRKLKIVAVSFYRTQLSLVRSMGPVDSKSLRMRGFWRLNWCDSGWWRYQLNADCQEGNSRQWGNASDLG